MLMKFVSETGKDWDNGLPYLLFAYREVPQASTGFSPFELLFAHQVRGPLDILRASWEQKDKPPKHNILSYVLQMREKLRQATDMAQANLQQSQEKQKTWYDKKARLRVFRPGDQVLLLLPTTDNKLLAKWQGPYKVTRKVSAVNYEIEIPNRQQPLQVFHVNMLKKWHEPTEQQEAVSSKQQLLVRAIHTEEETEEQYLPVYQDNGLLDLQHLDLVQRRQLLDSIPQHLFQNTPGRTDIIQHHIYLKDDKPIHQQPYRVPQKLLSTMKKELDEMLKLEVIEPSNSEWNNPIVLVPKKDGTIRFCLDFRKLNTVIKFDPYPMPRVDELIERLSTAQYLTTLDLYKGFWQIPLNEQSKELTAFKTPFGHFHFRVLPFGLHGAPSTFQRMIDHILRGTEAFAAAYLDDIIIFSEPWEQHLQHVKEILSKIRAAGLTIRPDKCSFAKPETVYLGHVLGRGVIRPQQGKLEATRDAKQPTTKKQIHSFLGLVGWYRHFIPQFSSRAVALTNKKDKPNKVIWTDDCEIAFVDLKETL
ncbi:hypothetical protein QQF64_004506 [Cirrhinus molitorella]|uniref:ribonuclease H n=1 Tax=Cirrhinus molitorella TaxID=172907 RepID=A0ABR3MIJ8_9TELE